MKSFPTTAHNSTTPYVTLFMEYQKGKSTHSGISMAKLLKSLAAGGKDVNLQDSFYYLDSANTRLALDVIGYFLKKGVTRELAEIGRLIQTIEKNI